VSPTGAVKLCDCTSQGSNPVFAIHAVPRNPPLIAPPAALPQNSSFQRPSRASASPAASSSTKPTARPSVQGGRPVAVPSICAQPCAASGCGVIGNSRSRSAASGPDSIA